MAKEQNYNNHIRYYPPHHFVFYPVMLALMGWCAFNAWHNEHDKALWITIGAGFGCLTWLAWMLRQHYALVLQNRTVVLELRYRYLAITGNRFEPIEQQLTDGQLYALRFAPDEEFAALAQRAVTENLSGDAIKKSIKNWKADHRRV